jgi:ApbE superfamily uncharacterized protein (UPF0280 family)
MTCSDRGRGPLNRKKHTRPSPEAYRRRDYRQLVHSSLQAERVVVQETDVTVYSEQSVFDAARESIIRHRGYIENYMRNHPDFLHSLEPISDDPLSAPVVRDMLLAGRLAGVGPMAAVAGALAEKVGRDLLVRSQQVIVENGGDVFIHARGALTIGVFAGPSPLSLKVGIRLTEGQCPLAVCTSSASVGHSLSLGAVDAACVISPSCALADAVATAMANRVKDAKDISTAIEWAKQINGVTGLVVILGASMGAWGKIQVVPI